MSLTDYLAKKMAHTNMDDWEEEEDVVYEQRKDPSVFKLIDLKRLPDKADSATPHVRVDGNGRAYIPAKVIHHLQLKGFEYVQVYHNESRIQFVFTNDTSARGLLEAFYRDRINGIELRISLLKTVKAIGLGVDRNLPICFYGYNDNGLPAIECLKL
jgi:bifunctional DNA-binding transcriptional regulator/antitoxin component of YhaV-PrlF toxin-antitoxin module